MHITTDMVKQLRERTGAGVLECKQALEETQGDLEAAAQLLRQKGLAVAAKKAGREAKEGVIDAYIHAGGGIGALIELNCETDFVARTEEFRTLAHDLAMQVAASNPRYLSRDDIPQEVIDQELAAYRQQALAEGKPEHIVERIAQGRLEKFFSEVVLLEQPFIKDPDRTVQELITDKIAELKENIVLRRFCRFELGEVQ